MPGGPPDRRAATGNRRPPRPPRPPRPARPPESALRQRGIAALILGVVSVLALLATGTNFHRGIFLVIFALVVGALACWLGGTASARARRAGAWRPRGALAGTIFGGFGIVLGIILLTVLAVFWTQFGTYSRCLAQAQTPSAQQACYDQLTRSVNDIVSGLSGTPGR